MQRWRQSRLWPIAVRLADVGRWVVKTALAVTKRVEKVTRPHPLRRGARHVEVLLKKEGEHPSSRAEMNRAGVGFGAIVWLLCLGQTVTQPLTTKLLGLPAIDGIFYWTLGLTAFLVVSCLWCATILE